MYISILRALRNPVTFSTYWTNINFGEYRIAKYYFVTFVSFHGVNTSTIANDTVALDTLGRDAHLSRFMVPNLRWFPIVA